MLWGDIRELKAVLEIDPANTRYDKNLQFYNEWVSGWFEEILNRDFSYKFRTQLYKGTGTQNLCLKCRPVFPLLNTAQQLTVTLDEAAFYGSAPGAFGSSATARPLIYGTDYCLKVDQDDGSSRSGILIRLNDLWPKPTVRVAGFLSPFISEDTGSIQVKYQAGYDISNLPSQLRMAANLAVAKIRHIFPLGQEISGEGYEERSLSYATRRDNYLLAVIKPMVLTFKNWRW